MTDNKRALPKALRPGMAPKAPRPGEKPGLHEGYPQVYETYGSLSNPAAAAGVPRKGIPAHRALSPDRPFIRAPPPSGRTYNHEGQGVLRSDPRRP